MIIAIYSAAIMFLVVFSIWAYQSARVFAMIKTRHPKVYEDMGCPNFFIHYSLPNNFSWLKYLHKREWVKLEDKEIASKAQFLITLSFVFMIIAILLIIGLILINI